MLWLRKLRSSSPPHLTSSVPEMERHLATMDLLADASLAPNFSVEAAGAPDDISTTPAHLQNGGETQTASELEAVANEDAFEKPNASTDEGIDPPAPKELSSIQSKARYSLPRLVALTGCVAYLLSHFLGLGLGLRLINGYASPRLHRAEVQLQAASNVLYENSVMHIGLDVLLGTELQQQYMESYEDCIVRGLHKAEQAFYGLDFTMHPDIRNQTTTWISDNCNRLHYTPQLHNPDTSMLQKVARNVQRSIEETLAHFKYKIELLRRRCRGNVSQITACQPMSTTSRNTTPQTNVSMNVSMPLDFTLKCDGRTRCRLIYSGPHVLSSDPTLMCEIILKARNEMKRWFYPSEKVFRINVLVVMVLCILHIFFLACCSLAVYLSCPRPTEHSKKPCESRLAQIQLQVQCSVEYLRMKENAKLAMWSLFNATLFTFLHWQMTYFNPGLHRFLLPLGLMLSTSHIVGALTFLLPIPGAGQNLITFGGALAELKTIFQGDEVFLETLVEKWAPIFQETSITSPADKPASKIGARFISPLTPLAEDLKQARKNLHAELVKQSRNVRFEHVSTIASDSDYDSDVQHASYVDLTGGATSTVSEEAEGWAIVQD